MIITNLCETISDTIEVTLGECECTVYIPNAFTPNADEMNDVFIPEMNCTYDYYSFMVFDRWGKLVFETDDQTKGWDGYVDGEIMHQGVYAWRLEKSFSGQSGVVSTMGDVVLIRR